MMARLGLLLSFLLVCALKSLPVYAQQDSSSLEGYVPPPMFGAQRPIPPKKAQPKVPKLPSISRPAPPASVDNKPAKEAAPQKVTPKPKSAPAATVKTTPKKKPVVKTVKPAEPAKKKATKPTVLPPIVPLEAIAIPTSKPELVVTPTEPIVEKALEKPKPIETHDTSSQLEPIDLIRQQQAKPEPKPVVKSAPKPKQSSGIVKGPKTMPAVKKKGVETEILFEPETKIKPAINPMAVEAGNKQEDQQENVEIVAVEEIPPQNYTAPKFSILPDGSRKLNLIFSEIQAELSAEQKHSLNQLIIPLLRENSKTRLRLEAYASPRDGSLSGDRRIALSRAMAMRKHIVDQNISANRLDVRSLGAQTDVVPMDRVEIFIVNQ